MIGVEGILPFDVFAASSIDALIHAVESMYLPKRARSPASSARRRSGLIVREYRKITEKGEPSLPEDITDFLNASTIAGVAFGNSGCAAVHALSYPIGGN